MTATERIRDAFGSRWAIPRLPGGLLDGLAPRLAALLTVALLPLGIIAVGQTRSLSDEVSRRSGLSLVLLTREAALPIQRAVEQAIGAAGALAAVADSIDGAGGAQGCGTILDGFTAPGSPYAFAAVQRRGGGLACSTGAPPFDPATLAELLDAPRPRVAASPASLPAASDEDPDALLVSAPYGGAVPRGLVTLALRRSSIAAVSPVAPGPIPLRLTVFNDRGQVLAETVREGRQDSAFQALDLAAQVGRDARVFPAEDGAGRARMVTVAPLIPGTLYAMAAWSPEDAVGPRWAVRPILFPIGMWLASLLVAFWAANRLMVSPMAGLVGRMRRFGSDRSLPDAVLPADSPRELREIEAAFRQTAQAILQDEARMENAFRERGVLLREIHHRVKNNLQLISSIISMQMRRAPDARVRAILRRLQDRVLTLAAIYRSLYTSADVSEASVAPILRAIIEQELAAHGGRVALSLRLDELVLDADKAVPLAFLVAEGVSNAALQAAQAPGERRVGVTLEREGDGARIEVVNTVPPAGFPQPGAGDDEGPAPGVASGRAALGLGSQLIGAFATQLGGRAEMGVADGVYRLVVIFPVGVVAPAEGGKVADEA